MGQLARSALRRMAGPWSGGYRGLARAEAIPTRRPSSESGQMIVTIALFGFFFMMLVALVWNVSSVWMTRRDLQNAADAAVLAGVQELDCTSNATLRANAKTKAEEWAAKNENDLDSNVATVDASGLWVRSDVQRDMPGFFGQFVGFEVTAKAKAEVQCATTNDAAIYAGDDTCNVAVLKLSGSNNIFIGGIHSEGGMDLSGSNIDYSEAPTFEDPCTQVNNTGTPAAPTPQAVPSEPWPIDRAPFDALLANPDNCTFEFNGDIDLSNATVDADGLTFRVGKALASGTYCATGKMTMSGEGMHGTVTLVTTRQIDINGSNFDLDPFFGGVLLYSSIVKQDGYEVSVSGSGGSWSGALFSPDTGMKVSGSNDLVINGSVIGWRVDVSGSNLSIEGGGSGGGIVKTYSLVE